MNLDDLKATYCTRHWQSLDEAARLHLAGFVEHIRSEFEAANVRVYTDGSTATGPGPLPDQSPAQQDAAAAKAKAAPAPKRKK